MSDWKKIISGVAPTIATALGGPLAGSATKFLTGALLGDENATEKQLEEYVLGANPDQLGKIKEIDNNYKIKMKELDVDVYELGVKNTKDARRSGDKIGHWPQIILGLATVIAFFGLIYFMVFEQMTFDETAEKFLYMLIGSLLTYASMVYRYFFGGNQSDDKNIEKIYNSIPK